MTPEMDAALSRLEVAATRMRDHADKMYDLIPDSKDPASAEYKGKHAAMWHEHEINKYRFQIDYIVSKIKKGEIE